jgi:hypothetical protein
MNKAEFIALLGAWIEAHDFDLSQASAALGVSKLRVHLYLTGWFVFHVEREMLVLTRAVKVYNNHQLAHVTGDSV